MRRPPRWTYFIITVIVILAALLALSAVAPGPSTARPHQLSSD
ncbi:MAG TPA: hypothetical protein VKB79_11015 [Bryobacteraceae bacterium]|nr:hypothetical protein [Bryobacteraceae bacterium]